MQELAHRRAGAPEHHLVAALDLRVVELADHRRQHVRGLEVEVVARAVEVRRHRRDVGLVVLATHRLDVQHAGDLGDGVGVVGRLQQAGEQGVLADRLLGELRVDAARAEEQQPLDADLVGGVDDVHLDADVVGEEVGRVGGVGHDAADLGRRQHDVLRDAARGRSRRRRRGRAGRARRRLRPISAVCPRPSRCRQTAEPTSPRWPATWMRASSGRGALYGESI